MFKHAIVRRPSHSLIVLTQVWEEVRAEAFAPSLVAVTQKLTWSSAVPTPSRVVDCEPPWTVVLAPLEEVTV